MSEIRNSISAGLKNSSYPLENSIFKYGANSSQRVTRPCSSGKKLLNLRNGKFYSLDKING
jgi:hypothetical protein